MDNPNQEMVCTDSNGEPTGQILDRKSAHSTPGTKHLAIQVLVFTPKKDIILHDRPLKKVGGGVWDATTTHVLNKETPEESAKRCLKDEYGIENPGKIVVLSGFSYDKDYEDGTCENEFCLAAYTVFEGEINANPEHAEKTDTIPAKQVKEELETKPEKYPVWFKDTVRIILENEEGKKLFE